MLTVSKKVHFLGLHVCKVMQIESTTFYPSPSASRIVFITCVYAHAISETQPEGQGWSALPLNTPLFIRLLSPSGFSCSQIDTLQMMYTMPVCHAGAIASLKLIRWCADSSLSIYLYRCLSSSKSRSASRSLKLQRLNSIVGPALHLSYPLMIIHLFICLSACPFAVSHKRALSRLLVYLPNVSLFVHTLQTFTTAQGNLKNLSFVFTIINISTTYLFTNYVHTTRACPVQIVSSPIHFRPPRLRAQKLNYPFWPFRDSSISLIRRNPNLFHWILHSSFVTHMVTSEFI